MFIKTALALALVLGTAAGAVAAPKKYSTNPAHRSEEHTSELQSRSDLVCRLLLEKKKQPRRRPLRTPNSVTRHKKYPAATSPRTCGEWRSQSPNSCAAQWCPNALGRALRHGETCS